MICAITIDHNPADENAALAHPGHPAIAACSVVDASDTIAKSRRIREEAAAELAAWDAILHHAA